MLPLHPADVTKLLTSLTLSINSFRVKNEKFSKILNHFNNIGITGNATKDLALLLRLAKQQLEIEIQGCSTGDTFVNRNRLSYLISNENAVMEEGHADLVLKAFVNILGFPIVLLTSLSLIQYIPMFPKNPVFKNQWLFMGVDFSGPVTFFVLAEDNTTSSAHGVQEYAKRARKSCSCGSKRREGKPKCVENAQYKCRCPCFNSQQPCTACLCIGCMNPHGTPALPGRECMEKKQGQSRKRVPPQLRVLSKSSATYLEEHGESSSSGQWTQEETFFLVNLLYMGKEEGEIIKEYNQQVNSKTSEIQLSCKSSQQIKGKVGYLKGQKELILAKLSVVAEDLISEMLR